jgi:hypothetical protein
MTKMDVGIKAYVGSSGSSRRLFQNLDILHVPCARFLAHIQTSPGVHPASCTMDTGSFLGVKRPGHDADYPPPSSTEVKKGYSYTSIHSLGQFRPVTCQYIFSLIIFVVSKPRRLRISHHHSHKYFH